MSDSFVRVTNGTTWPNPNDPKGVQWELRNGNPSKSQIVVAAAFMDAYRNLMLLLRDDRERVIGELRDYVSVENEDDGL